MQIISLILIVLLFTGCTRTIKHYTISYEKLVCKSFRDVGIRLKGGVYECFGKELIIEKPKRIWKEKKVKPKPIAKRQYVAAIKTNGCPTQITKIYNSKASGKITICKGKLLKEGEKTVIRRVNE